MSEFDYIFQEFQLWYRMEILTREFPDIPRFRLLKEALQFSTPGNL